MNGGDLNLRNDDLLDKLDSSPREDVDKLIKLGKTLNKNNVGTIIRDSLNAIEENIFNLNSLNENYSTSNISKTTPSDFKETFQKTVFTKLSDNLDNKASNFIGHIEKLYKLLFIPYSKELLIKNKLGYNINNNTTDEYVNNRVLGRILYNIHYFRRYTKIYVKGEFRSIISKIKDSLSNKNYLGTDLYKKIETNVNILYNNNDKITDYSLINWNIGQTIFDKDTKAETKYNKIIQKTLENKKLIITQYMIDTVFIELIKVIQGELKDQVGAEYKTTTTIVPIKLILLARIKKKYEFLKKNNNLPIVGAANVATDANLINVNIDRSNESATMLMLENAIRVLETTIASRTGVARTAAEQELLNYQKDVLDELLTLEAAAARAAATGLAARAAAVLRRPPAPAAAAVPTPVSTSDKTELVKTIIEVLKNNGIVITDINAHLYKFIDNQFYTATIIQQLLIEIIYKLYNLIDEYPSISEIKNKELIDGTNDLKGNEELINPKVKDETKKVVKSVLQLIMDPIHYDAKEIENETESIIVNVENPKTQKALRLIAYIAAYDIIKNPPSNFDTVNRNVLVKKITNNMRLILESESDSTSLDYTINAICLHLYIYREFETKGMFFALEVYYGIIYGSTLRYDLKMLKENEYIIERLEQLDKTYSIIKSIVTDDTFRTLKKMYYKKYPGILNIFRIDTKELTIIKPVKENTTIINNIKEDYTSQEEYRLKDLVILDIKNGGNVDVEEFKKNLKIIYSKKDYQTVFNICNLTNYCIILANQFENCIEDNNIDVIMCEKIYDSFKTTFDDLNAEIEKMKGDNSVINKKLKDEIKDKTDILEQLSGTLTKLNNEFTTKITAATPAGAATPAATGTTTGNLSISTAKVAASSGGPGVPGPVVPGPVGVPPRSSLTVNTTTVKIVGGSVADITELTRIFNELIKAVKKTIDKDNDNDNDKDNGDNGAASNGNKLIKKTDNPTTKPTNDTDTLVKQLKQILSMEDTPTTDILDLFNNYKKDKKLGGGYENRVIDFPVSQVNTNCSLLPIELKTPDEYANLIKGGDSDEVAKKRDELKKTLENINFEDDITESVSDNAKRKVTELTADFQEFIEKPVNIEQDETKLLDDEYIDVLEKFNINDIKTNNYQDLRKNLYRIKSSEYFEDIKITNEDIYTFIATTYILRVISLYIVLWFIQIEIIKDVESVIVCYILTYILLFILVYTFVNLSDNKLDTTKSYLYYFYSRVNFSYTRFIVHLGLLFLLIIIPFIIRTVDKESTRYKNITDTEKRYLYTFITNMSTIVWVILSIIAFFFK